MTFNRCLIICNTAVINADDYSKDWKTICFVLPYEDKFRTL